MITYCIIDYSTDLVTRCSKTNILIALAFILHKSIHLLPDIDFSIGFEQHTIANFGLFKPHTTIDFSLALNRFIIIVNLDHSISLKASFKTAVHRFNRHNITALLAVGVSRNLGSSC